MTNESTALEVVEADYTSMIVMPAAGPDKLVEAMQAYQKTKDAILQESDYQTIQGRKFTKRSGFTKLAIAYACSTEIIRVDKERDADGHCCYAEAVVRATAPNGRFAEGWGACSTAESRFANAAARQKADHDVPATATTRAQNRACASLFGHGEVSYEEATGGGQERPAATTERPAKQPSNGKAKEMEEPKVARPVMVAFITDCWVDDPDAAASQSEYLLKKYGSDDIKGADLSTDVIRDMYEKWIAKVAEEPAQESLV